jgi:hypothetical protein
MKIFSFPAALPAIAAATVMLGGCATYGSDPLGGIFGGDPYGNDEYRNDRYGADPRSDPYGTGYSNDFERAAFNACGQRATRYGRVAIDGVDQVTRDSVRVVGRTDSRDRRRDEFTCTFRSDGRVIDFRVY